MSKFEKDSPSRSRDITSFVPGLDHRNLRISEFSPSRKKLNISKNPWHHPLALGPSIDLPTSYIVSKFEKDSPSGSRDITIFVPGLDLTEKSDILKFSVGWYPNVSATLSDRPSAALCPCRVPRNPWKLLRPSELPANTSESFPATRKASRDLPQPATTSRYLPTALDSQGYIMNCINL